MMSFLKPNFSALFLLSATFLFSVDVFGQSVSRTHTEYHGMVSESKSHISIGGATCYLKNNRHVGAVVNSDGSFTIRIANEFLNDTLVVSHLGYHNALIPICDLVGEGATNPVELSPKAFLLDGVLVEDTHDFLAQLVLKAYKKIPKNYPKKLHELKGLYRKLSTEEDRYIYLEEGLVTIQDHGSRPNRPVGRTHISMSAFRQSQQYGHVDSAVVAKWGLWREYKVQLAGRSHKSLWLLYLRNRLRAHPRSRFDYERLKENIEGYNFRLMDVSRDGNDTIYQVAFGWSPNPEVASPLPGDSYLKINSHDMAIVEYQMTSDGTYSYDYNKLQTRVAFRQLNGLYYPSEITVLQQGSIQRDYDFSHTDISTFWFDEVLDNNIPTPYNKEEIEEMKLGNFDFWPYDPAQWINNKNLKMHPLPDDVQNSLELEKPLEEQFKKTGQNDL